jgi:hypothetical protein
LYADSVFISMLFLYGQKRPDIGLKESPSGVYGKICEAKNYRVHIRL